ncbi:hypothetical protein DM860_001132 [Cuscuta australis]|uniref:Folate transporter 1, chloroplastic n=1 Tax=Cuscuta australis TaxID=267555 RepID=A0A328DT34_9ASTE|nr:hypothetical protein DM860_001132 [Cuscuta australis]
MASQVGGGAENAASGAIAGFATVAAMHPLDVIRTRFQVNDGRRMAVPSYKNTPHALFTIARCEGLRGLYAGFFPAVLGSSISWGLFFFFYGRAKQRYAGHMEKDEKLNPSFHLAAAAEAGALVSFCTNPVWLIKTRLQLQNPLHQTRQYAGVYDALRTILKEEGWTALYRGIWPSLFLLSYSSTIDSGPRRSFTLLVGQLLADKGRDIRVPRSPHTIQEDSPNCTTHGLHLFVPHSHQQVSHGAIQFTAYEELRKLLIDFKSRRTNKRSNDELLNSLDYSFLGGSSKVAAILSTYPFQVIRSRLQQRPSIDGIHRYTDSLHAVKETARFEGIRGFYKGITANLLKNVPASAVTFVVYENVLKLFKLVRSKD